MKPLYKILSLIPATIMLSVIFIFSAQQGNTSGALSSNITKTIVTVLNPSLNEDEIDKKVNALHTPIRKLAHFSEYFLLSLSFILPLNVFEVKGRKVIFIAIFLSLISASFDEYHQSFVPGRAMCFTDVLIDLSGAITSSALYYFLRKRRKQI